MSNKYGIFDFRVADFSNRLVWLKMYIPRSSRSSRPWPGRREKAIVHGISDNNESPVSAIPGALRQRFQPLLDMLS